MGWSEFWEGVGDTIAEVFRPSTTVSYEPFKPPTPRASTKDSLTPFERGWTNPYEGYDSPGDYYAAQANRYREQYGIGSQPGELDSGSRDPDVPEPEEPQVADVALEVTYEQYGVEGPMVFDDSGYLIPSGASGAFAGARQLLAEEEIGEFWDTYVGLTGVEDLKVKYGIETDWFPGMELQPMNTFEQRVAQGGFAGLKEHLQYEGQIPEEWAIGQLVTGVDPETQQSGQMWVHYDTSKSAQSFAAMSTNDRQMYTDLMVQAGLIPEGYAGISQFTAETASGFTEATRWANYYGVSVKKYLEERTALNEQINANSGGGGRGGGGGGAARRYTIEVPDYDSLKETAKKMMRQQLGRDPKAWEVTLIADELQAEYGNWAEAQKRKALGGNGVYEVPDPIALTEGFIESKYEDEISRLEDVEDQSQNNRLLVRAATMGGAINSPSQSQRQLR